MFKPLLRPAAQVSVLFALSGCSLNHSAGDGHQTIAPSAQRKSSLLLASGARWPAPEIPVCWEDRGFREEKRWIQLAVERSWQAHSGIRFVGWRRCHQHSAGVRVGFIDEASLTPEERSVPGAASSLVKRLGKAGDGVANGVMLNITYEVWGRGSCQQSTGNRRHCIEAISIHEFGHVLGFAHEQNRSDTRLLDEDCAQRRQGELGDQPLGHWDVHSVMNYCNPKPHNNARLSPGDIAGLQQVYGLPAPAKSSAVFCKGGPVELADVNGDGADDWLCPREGGVEIDLAAADGAYGEVDERASLPDCENGHWQSAQVDNDGLADLICFPGAHTGALRWLKRMGRGYRQASQELTVSACASKLHRLRTTPGELDVIYCAPAGGEGNVLWGPPGVARVPPCAPPGRLLWARASDGTRGAGRVQCVYPTQRTGEGDGQSPSGALDGVGLRLSCAEAPQRVISGDWNGDGKRQGLCQSALSLEARAKISRSGQALDTPELYAHCTGPEQRLFAVDSLGHGRHEPICFDSPTGMRFRFGLAGVESGRLELRSSTPPLDLSQLVQLTHLTYRNHQGDPQSQRR